MPRRPLIELIDTIDPDRAAMFAIAEEVRNDPRVIAAYLGVPDEELPLVEKEVRL